MTINEVSEKYNIPMSLLLEYERLGLCESVKKVLEVFTYSEQDVERLSLIMTLQDIGFTKEEIIRYIDLVIQGKKTKADRKMMLVRIRECTLARIHKEHICIDQIDYLRHELEKE